MLIQTQIENVISSAKAGLGNLLNNIIISQYNGDDVKQLKFQFIAINKWIELLGFYLDNNFNENGNIVPPTQECLTLDQIALIMSKLTSIFGNNPTPESDWILANYVWDDNGFWRDTATWNDVKPII